jgi:hypothetical protein
MNEMTIDEEVQLQVDVEAFQFGRRAGSLKFEGRIREMDLVVADWIRYRDKIPAKFRPSAVESYRDAFKGQAG